MSEKKNWLSKWWEKYRKLLLNLLKGGGVYVAIFAVWGPASQPTHSFGRWLFGYARPSGPRQIEVCANEMILVTPRPAVGATVRCWDKDIGGDDLMAEGLTTENGCAYLTYEDKSWDGLLGRNPDIYCTVDQGGFVTAVPPDLDHHDPSKLAKFETVTLFRDRMNDYGDDNACGPQRFKGWGNDSAAWVLRFKEQCTHHDKCYYDCQIFLALGGDAAKAEAFCDNEMYQGMKSVCHATRGQLQGIGEDACLLKAKVIHGILSGFYDKTTATCPFDKDGNRDKSMNNDYSHTKKCHFNGSHCGYDGTITDDNANCNLCCEGPVAKHPGYVWDDHYCKCFPSGNFCGSTRFGNSFDGCDKCCSGKKSVDEGWLWTNTHCE